MLLQVGAEAFGDHGLDLALHLRVAQPGLGLAFELGLGELDADHGDEPFTHVLAGEVGVAVLEQLLLAAVVVQGAGEGGAEAGEVAAAVDGVDAVGEGEGGLGEAVVVLDRGLDRGVVDLALDVDRAGVEDFAVVVQVADEAGDAAFEVEVHLAVVALVDEVDPDALGQVGVLAEALDERLEVVVEGVEDLAVRQEAGDGAAGGAGAVADLVGVPGLLDLLHLGLGVAAGVLLAVDLAVLVHLHPRFFGEGVDDGRTDAVEPARDLVGAATELAAGVEVGHHRFQGGLAGAGVLVDRDAAAVVADQHVPVLLDRDPNVVAVAGHRLVDRVVDDLDDQVVEAALIGAADVHPRPAAHRLQALEDLDVAGGVVVLRLAVFRRLLGGRCFSSHGPPDRFGTERDHEVAPDPPAA